jgi:uncharacterized protein (TIGR03083 family)
VDEVLEEARGAVADVGGRVVELLRGATDGAAPVSDRWTVRDAAAHLVGGTALYRELALGAPSPVPVLTPDALAHFNDERIADVAASGPALLGEHLAHEVAGFVAATDGRPGGQPVCWHGRIPVDLAQLTCVLLGEYVVHGYDLATALDAPWPVDPGHAALVLHGYGPLQAHSTDPVTAAGHTAAYGIDLGGDARSTVRFTDGAVTVTPGAPGPVDCEIGSDPVTFLLVGTGRLSQWAAVALGLLRAGGPRPELATGFGRLFRFP